MVGTYRTPVDSVKRMEQSGVHLVHCDLAVVSSIRDACAQLRIANSPWDVLMTCPAAREPIAPFLQTNFDEWEHSISVNFTQQMRIVHALLPVRRQGGTRLPIVILFAGGGTNDAPLNYSPEIIAKIAQIKMCELLSAEIPDTRFVIVGPGWVKTKTHKATLKVGEKAGTNYQRTIQKLNSDECTPMDRVIDFLDWTIEQPRELISGRNFSIVNDMWGTDLLKKKLLETPDMFKLRRFLNDWKGEDGQ